MSVRTTGRVERSTEPNRTGSYRFPQQRVQAVLQSIWLAGSSRAQWRRPIARSGSPCSNRRPSGSSSSLLNGSREHRLGRTGTSSFAPPNLVLTFVLLSRCWRCWQRFTNRPACCLFQLRAHLNRPKLLLHVFQQSFFIGRIGRSHLPVRSVHPSVGGGGRPRATCACVRIADGAPFTCHGRRCRRILTRRARKCAASAERTTAGGENLSIRGSVNGGRRRDATSGGSLVSDGRALFQRAAPIGSIDE